MQNGGNGDGKLDAGETVGISVLCGNNGHATMFNATCTLTSTSEWVTINTNEVYIGEIIVDAQLPAVFSITIDEAIPVGTTIDLVFTLTSGAYTEEVTVNIPVGIQIEDFETGDFTNYDWTMGGNADWTISTDAQEGTYSAVSGNINDGQTSQLSITCNVTADGQISFWSKVSSESGFDYLRFYIDGSKQAEWAGTASWTEHTYNVDAGSHTFKWAYEKDGSVSNGSDCGWVDFITFPGFSSKHKSKDITFDIDNSTIPEWLTLTDIGSGNATLIGTAPNENGTHDVNIIATDGGSNTTEQPFVITVGQVNIDSHVGTVQFYPNPTTGLLNVEIPNTTENAQLIITDISGKIVEQTTIVNQKSTVDLSKQAKGIYMLRLTIGSEIINQKVVVE